MSRLQTGPISMTDSWTSSDSDGGVGEPPGRAGSATRVITCGALAGHIRDIATRRGWDLAVHPLPAGLHNRPDQIPKAVSEAGTAAIVAYADCGTYGKLDELLERTDGTARARRLPGLHCYDLLAGPGTVSDVFHVEPGTYLLTDYLVRTFDRTVVASLGLDRYPELWPDYFGHYTRVTWLAQGHHRAGGRGHADRRAVRPAPVEDRHWAEPPGSRPGGAV